jgi:23S rRNA (guanosine2251-2'-O)-methyltransferase
MSDTELWIWGRQPVLEAVRAGSARSILLVRSNRQASILDAVREAAAAANVTVRECHADDVERVAPGQVTQGIAARVSVRLYDDAVDLLSSIPDRGTPFLLAIDQVQDPHNLGALIRTAGAAGAHGVLFPTHRTAGITGTVVKVSAGAALHVPLAQITNLAQTLRDLASRGVWSIGLDGEAKSDLFSVDLTVPLCLVVGSEGDGLRRLTRERCDLLAYLPMDGRGESLNASVAGGIALYEVKRQRRAVSPPGTGRP